MNLPDPSSAPAVADLTEAERDAVRQLRGLRFGSLEIQVHDGRIVQIERRERSRFDDRGRAR